MEKASGILLLAAAAIALICANSPWADSYVSFWHVAYKVSVGDHNFEYSPLWLVNDGLMTIFFYVVALEIRWELQSGSLSSWRRAAFPAMAAAGGMVMPAAIFFLIASKPTIVCGWGIPTATDIAFAVGVLSVLGKRVPAALRILLLAVAVIDDLGAIAIITFFYSEGAAGIPPTIAGVILGFLTPPKKNLIKRLQPWSNFAIMPIFALANSTVRFSGFVWDESTARVFFGVMLGLFCGKPVGILGVSWLATRWKIAKLPSGLTFRHTVLLGILAGIGFTMSLFIAQLAFTEQALLSAAKLGVLAASAAAMLLSFSVECLLSPPLYLRKAVR